jgi:phospholipase/carboxylesterase
LVTAWKEDLMTRNKPELGHGAGEGRLRSRPLPHVHAERKSGLQPFQFGGRRDGLLYIPTTNQRDRPAPLIVMLHGAGGSAGHGITPFIECADKVGCILLAPESRGGTWDLLLGRPGPDVRFIDRALELVFEHVMVDRTRLAIGGFSDGASYALSLGIANGDLFSHVIALSPGFLAPPKVVGMPRLFVSHGTLDDVLPIDRCSRRIVPQVEQAGYDVRYREFQGAHTMPADIVAEAMGWLVEGGASEDSSGPSSDPS